MSNLNKERTAEKLAVSKRFLKKELTEDITFQKVMNYLMKFKDVIPSTYQIYCVALTIGVSTTTATCENSFSTLNRIIISHRQSMSHNRKTHFILLGFGIRFLI